MKFWNKLNKLDKIASVGFAIMLFAAVPAVIIGTILTKNEGWKVVGLYGSSLLVGFGWGIYTLANWLQIKEEESSEQSPLD